MVDYYSRIFVLLVALSVANGFHMQNQGGVRAAVCRRAPPCCPGHVCRAFQRFNAARPVAACAVNLHGRPLYAPGSRAQQMICRQSLFRDGPPNRAAMGRMQRFNGVGRGNGVGGGALGGSSAGAPDRLDRTRGFDSVRTPMSMPRPGIPQRAPPFLGPERVRGGDRDFPGFPPMPSFEAQPGRRDDFGFSSGMSPSFERAPISGQSPQRFGSTEQSPRGMDSMPFGGGRNTQMPMQNPGQNGFQRTPQSMRSPSLDFARSDFRGFGGPPDGSPSRMALERGRMTQTEQFGADNDQMFTINSRVQSGPNGPSREMSVMSQIGPGFSFSTSGSEFSSGSSSASSMNTPVFDMQSTRSVDGGTPPDFRQDFGGPDPNTQFISQFDTGFTIDAATGQGFSQSGSSGGSGPASFEVQSFPSFNAAFVTASGNDNQAFQSNRNSESRPSIPDFGVDQTSGMQGFGISSPRQDRGGPIMTPEVQSMQVVDAPTQDMMMTGQLPSLDQSMQGFSQTSGSQGFAQDMGGQGFQQINMGSQGFQQDNTGGPGFSQDMNTQGFSREISGQGFSQDNTGQGFLNQNINTGQGFSQNINDGRSLTENAARQGFMNGQSRPGLTDTNNNNNNDPRRPITGGRFDQPLSNFGSQGSFQRDMAAQFSGTFGGNAAPRPFLVETQPVSVEPVPSSTREVVQVPVAREPMGQDAGIVK